MKYGVLITLTGLTVLVVLFSAYQASLYPSPVPFGAQIEDSITIYFSYKNDLERLFEINGKPTDIYDYPIDRSNLPSFISLGHFKIKVVNSWQDEKGCAVALEIENIPFILYVERPSGITTPIKITSDYSIYIIGAKLPEIKGAFFTEEGDYFYGFKSVTIALVR
jgi:hypothetical protein